MELYISNQVVREYIANATRPQTYSPAISMNDVLAQVEEFQESFHILPDSPAVLGKLLELARTTTRGGKQIHDANIVATMLAHGINTLFTFNAVDFQRYAGHVTIMSLD